MATVINVKAPEWCDRCGAQAFWLYEHEAAGDLRFCGHHSSQHRTALLAADFSLALIVIRTYRGDPVKA